MTLTLKSGKELAPHLAELDKAFRALLDFRIGRNNRAKIRQRVAAKIESLRASSTITEQTANEWMQSTERWLEMVERQEKKRGKSFKLRKLMKGLSSLEITYNILTILWHAHRHLIISMPYMPQIVLSEIWSLVTKGRGEIVDVRAIKDIQTGITEAIKYTTKPWEIPEDKQEELLAALKGKKRIKAIGKIKPKKEPKPCPGCDKEDCTCRRVAVVNMSDQVSEGAFDVPSQTAPTRLHIYRDEKNRLTWRMEQGASVLSLYRAKYQEKGAFHSSTDPPSNPYVSISRDLTIDLTEIYSQNEKPKQPEQLSQLVFVV